MPADTEMSKNALNSVWDNEALEEAAFTDFDPLDPEDDLLDTDAPLEFDDIFLRFDDLPLECTSGPPSDTSECIVYKTYQEDVVSTQDKQIDPIAPQEVSECAFIQDGQTNGDRQERKTSLGRRKAERSCSPTSRKRQSHGFVSKFSSMAIEQERRPSTSSYYSDADSTSANLDIDAQFAKLKESIRLSELSRKELSESLKLSQMSSHKLAPPSQAEKPRCNEIQLSEFMMGTRTTLTSGLEQSRRQLMLYFQRTESQPFC